MAAHDPAQSQRHIGPDYDGCAECAPRRTKPQRAIHDAAEAKGYRVVMLQWEPIGAMVEMSGREGGWTVYGERISDGLDDHALGYRYDDVVEWITERWDAD